LVAGNLSVNCFSWQTGRESGKKAVKASPSARRVARASLEELLLDYQDFLRQKGLQLWDKGHVGAQQVRKLAYEANRSYETYRTYVEKASPEVAANTIICLVHQANYLLDQLLRQLEQQFVSEGGFTEKLYRVRQEARKKL
jgi:four helix bundle suffix protein